MGSRTRLDQIEKYVIQNGHADIDEIGRLFNISTATARRNLDRLAEAGKIQRVHGGATALEKAPLEPPIHLRMGSQAEEKRIIGRAAIDLIDDGDTVLMGGGTTVLEVAKQLVSKKNLTVITNSLMVINALSVQTHITVVILGGFLRHAEQLSYGVYTEQILSELFVDKVVLGARAISIERGLSIDSLPELATERLLIKKGKEIIVVADHTKFNREATYPIGSILSINHIVTDNQTPEITVCGLREIGIDVIVAENLITGTTSDLE